MKSIGGRKVVFNKTFIAPYGETVEFELQVWDAKIPVEISIVEEESKDGSAAI